MSRRTLRPSLNLWSEPPTIFRRAQESLDHLSLEEVAVELVQFIQPEVITIEVTIRWIIRVAAQVAEILHLHDRARQLTADEVGNLRHLQQSLSAGRRIAGLCR